MSKEVQTTARRVYGAVPVLLAFGVRKLPPALSLPLGRSLRVLKEERDTIEQERTKLVGEYGLLEESGRLVTENGQVIMRDQKGFDIEWQCIMNQALTITVYPVDLSKLDELEPNVVEAMVAVGLWTEDGNAG